jgi:hypothetical protein
LANVLLAKVLLANVPLPLPSPLSATWKYRILFWGRLDIFPKTITSCNSRQKASLPQSSPV